MRRLNKPALFSCRFVKDVWPFTGHQTLKSWGIIFSCREMNDKTQWLTSVEWGCLLDNSPKLQMKIKYTEATKTHKCCDCKWCTLFLVKEKQFICWTLPFNGDLYWRCPKKMLNNIFEPYQIFFWKNYCFH